MSTPRSGNTWTRRLLATAYGLQEWAVHKPDDLDWDGLSRRCLLQLHWHHVEPFTTPLDRHGFQVVVLTRHPLDVLMSILHFAPNEPQTARWLEGEGGDEVAIHGALPCSRAAGGGSSGRSTAGRPVATSAFARPSAATPSGSEPGSWIAPWSTTDPSSACFFGPSR